jgi:hypothetical protein
MTKYPNHETQKQRGKEHLLKRLLNFEEVYFTPDTSANGQFEWFEGTAEDVIEALDQLGHFDKLIDIPGYDVGNLESAPCTEYPNPYSEEESRKASGHKFIHYTGTGDEPWNESQFTYLAVVRSEEGVYYWRMANTGVCDY